jgi:hypothetical protein
MNEPRHIRDEESELIVSMLTKVGRHMNGDALRSAQVIDMKDGGMGSIRFISSEESKYASTLASAEYTDVDNVPVSITINSDQEGKLMELDIWKVDFSPLCRYPTTSDLRNICEGESR